MSANKPIPAVANTVNADLVPKVRKWLEKNHPDSLFTDGELSTLLCYATTPEDFSMPTSADAVKAFHAGTLQTVEGAMSILPDRGMNEIHRLMLRDPDAVLSALIRFRIEDARGMGDKIRRAIRRENCEGLSGNELVRFLTEDTGEIPVQQAATVRRRLQEMRRDDGKLDPKAPWWRVTEG